MHRYIKVLTISDTPEDITLIKNLLAEANKQSKIYYYSTDPVALLQETERHLVRNTYDVALLDYIVPGADITPFELIERVSAGGCKTPIIILTNLSDDQIEWQVSVSSALDYLHKEIDLTGDKAARILTRSIKYALNYCARLHDMQQSIEDLSKRMQDVTNTLRMNYNR